MARIKLGYIGGGSTRAVGTMASFLHRSEDFDGSEVVLYDIVPDRLATVETLARKLATASGHDIRVSSTTDRQEALADCDAILTSFRPGGFEARYLDESIPLRHGVIGQETQGPGGFFMALRTINVMRDIVNDINRICPNAWLFNYTNPINIVSEALTHHTDVKMVSLCEGPIIFPAEIASSVGLDPTKLTSTMIGINHACWSVEATYDGAPFFPILEAAYGETLASGIDERSLRMARLAIAMQSIPASYFQYYFFRDEIFAELQAKPTTRSQDILERVPDYWSHYEEQARATSPKIDPARSRGGIHELELAIDAMDALFNDTNDVLPVNVPNRGALPDFPDDRVVEVPAKISRAGIAPIVQPMLPRQVVGLVQHLADYQSMAAETAWSGTRREGIQTLAAHPLVMSLEKATSIYDELAHAHRAYLPDRLRQ